MILNWKWEMLLRFLWKWNPAKINFRAGQACKMCPWWLIIREQLCFIFVLREKVLWDVYCMYAVFDAGWWTSISVVFLDSRLRILKWPVFLAKILSHRDFSVTYVAIIVQLYLVVRKVISNNDNKERLFVFCLFFRYILFLNTDLLLNLVVAEYLQMGIVYLYLYH